MLDMFLKAQEKKYRMTYHGLLYNQITGKGKIMFTLNIRIINSMMVMQCWKLDLFVKKSKKLFWQWLLNDIFKLIDKYDDISLLMFLGGPSKDFIENSWKLLTLLKISIWNRLLEYLKNKKLIFWKTHICTTLRINFSKTCLSQS